MPRSSQQRPSLPRSKGSLAGFLHGVYLFTSGRASSDEPRCEYFDYLLPMSVTSNSEASIRLFTYSSWSDCPYEFKGDADLPVYQKWLVFAIHVAFAAVVAFFCGFESPFQSLQSLSIPLTLDFSVICKITEPSTESVSFLVGTLMQLASTTLHCLNGGFEPLDLWNCCFSSASVRYAPRAMSLDWFISTSSCFHYS